ncbi:MAG: hypothetical protein GY910_23350 [bacterium]|nr:hypothetical protein [bacterium]
MREAIFRSPHHRFRILVCALAAVAAQVSCAGPTEHVVEPYRSSKAKAFVLSKRAAAQCVLSGQNDRIRPTRPIVTDGCSRSPDTVWKLSCCVEHDIAYWCGGDAEARRTADAALGRCVRENAHPHYGLVDGDRCPGRWPPDLPLA